MKKSKKKMFFSLKRGILMNVFINTSVKVKQNKLTKHWMYDDDEFHRQRQQIHITSEYYTMCDAKNIHVFFIWTNRKRQKMSRKICYFFFLLFDIMLLSFTLCYNIYFIYIYVVYDSLSMYLFNRHLYFFFYMQSFSLAATQ